MTRHTLTPTVLGTLMGALMLWMLHRQVLVDGAPDIAALAMFIAAHVLVLAVLLLLPVIATPRLRAWAARLHRPTPRHVGLMLLGAVIGAAVFHVSAHGIWH